MHKIKAKQKKIGEVAIPNTVMPWKEKEIITLSGEREDCIEREWCKKRGTARILYCKQRPLKDQNVIYCPLKKLNLAPSRTETFLIPPLKNTFLTHFPSPHQNQSHSFSLTPLSLSLSLLHPEKETPGEWHESIQPFPKLPQQPHLPISSSSSSPPPLPSPQF
jgi:hypothetical protein